MADAASIMIKASGMQDVTLSSPVLKVMINNHDVGYGRHKCVELPTRRKLVSVGTESNCSRQIGAVVSFH